MSNTEYKLYYFPVRALAETIRLIFAQANVSYIDERVPFDEFVDKYKSAMPFEQMPVLEIDGKTRLAQTLVICEYLAAKYDLTYTDDRLKEAQVSMFGALYSELMYNVVEFIRVATGRASGDITEVEQRVLIPNMHRIGRILERQLVGNTMSRWLIGNKLTWPDLAMAEILDRLLALASNRTLLDDYPRVKQHMTNVFDLPNIKKWIENRPKTSY